MPSLACYLLVGNSDRGQYPASIVCLGFLLLGSSTALFAFSAGLDFHRFQLPSLNPINASHSFFVLSLFSISCLANRQSSLAKSLCSAGVAAFGVSMGIYAGSRGALLAFVCAFLVIFLYRSLISCGRWFHCSFPRICLFNLTPQILLVA